MFPRFLALFLALVMLWSGVAVVEQRFAEALGVPASTADASRSGKRSDASGSMDDHWVDDQPSQPFSEPALDSALLMDMQRAVLCPEHRVSSPMLVDEVPRAPPLLEGLRRPPRVA
ncbi:MAG: hypothetical protein EOP14_02180 [Pseudomonas sp.]|nr:MAG: hypothetical protein EOP14_02180 [Pseudomonas sp.]